MNGCALPVRMARVFIEMRALGAVVPCVQEKTVRKGLLQIQIPDLHVAQAVIRVDREIIRHRATGCSRKSVDQCQVTGLQDS